MPSGLEKTVLREDCLTPFRPHEGDEPERAVFVAESFDGADGIDNGMVQRDLERRSYLDRRHRRVGCIDDAGIDLIAEHMTKTLPYALSEDEPGRELLPQACLLEDFLGITARGSRFGRAERDLLRLRTGQVLKL